MAIVLTDASGNGNTLTNVSATESSNVPFATGNNTVAVDVEASTPAYLYANDSASLSFTSDFTLEVWANFETLGAFQSLICKDNNTLDKSFDFFINTSNKVEAYFFSATDQVSQCNSDAAVIGATATWVHIAISWDISVPTAVVYVNGSSVASTMALTNATTMKDSSGPLGIGALVRTGPTPSLPFDGILDEVRVWDDIRTGTEISNNYNIQLANPTGEANLKAYYPFNPLSQIKTWDGLAYGSVKTVEGLAVASVKKINGLQ